jgi:hypothetical protein
MGYIKEPEGIDFIVEGRILTKEEELVISDFIRDYKNSHSQKIAQKRRKTKKKQDFPAFVS